MRSSKVPCYDPTGVANISGTESHFMGRGYQFARLSCNNKLSEVYIIINDTHLCKDTYQVSEFSRIVNNGLNKVG